MIFEEWADKYGMESARKQFGMGDHLVLVVHSGLRVTGHCGSWVGSEPLCCPTRNPSVEVAKQRIRNSLRNCFKTEETIIQESKV